jgi:hypothetical protein
MPISGSRQIVSHFKNDTNNYITTLTIVITRYNCYLLWYPEFVPHMTGGASPPPPVTEKVSLRHRVPQLAATPPRNLRVM